MAEQVLLYDTTLRDGMQGEGMSLSAEEKVRVAHALDELGVHLIEGGFPASNPKEEALFELLSGETFEHAEVAAFGMTRRKDVAAADDPALRLLADCFAPVCTLVGKTWSLHLEKVTRVDPEENLRMIADSVAFLRGEGKRVIYDAEHFFDAYADDPDYALRCLRAAAEAGAENLTVCDTNGATLPSAVEAAVAAVVAELGDGVQIGIHAHDDAGCGVANSVAAVQSGARLVQGTVNGYGERCGNANLMTILANLQLKLGYECVEPAQLARLTETAHLVDELCNVAPNPNQPYVGRERLRAQGRHARRRHQSRRAHLRAHRPRRGRRRPAAADLRAERQGHGRSARRQDRRASSTPRAPRASSSGSRSSSIAATSSRRPTARSTC